MIISVMLWIILNMINKWLDLMDRESFAFGTGMMFMFAGMFELVILADLLGIIT